MEKKNVFEKIISASFLSLSLIAGGIIGLKSNSIKTIEVFAANDIETSTGVTISSNESAYFTATDNWKSKVLVFEIKSSETVVKFQLKGSSGAAGIIGTEDGISAVKYESQKYVLDNNNSYWGDHCYSHVLTDGWYRWVVDLSDYKCADMSNQAVRIKCLHGTGVQVRNLKFYDEMYIEANVIGGYVTTPLTNWASQEIAFDIKLPDDTKRRIQLCKESGSGVSGLIVCTKTELKYESLSGNPYWETSTTAPVSLGNDWYHFVVDLSKVKIAKDRDGKETVEKIKNLPENSDGKPVIEIKNFGLNIPPYNPADDADLVLEAGKRTTIPDIPSWSQTTISFEVYHDSLDLSCDPQFIFGEENLDKNITSYFGFKDIGGETALWLRNTNEGNYWVKASTQPELVENGWYKWTIDLSELRAEASSGAETIGNIKNRGANDVYIRNFSIDSVYNPADDADLVLKSGTKTQLLESIPYWQYSKISFEIYHGSLDLGVDPQFQFIAENSDKYVTGYFGYKSIYHKEALWLRNASAGDYWVESTYQPELVEKGWYKWTIDLSELGNGENCTGEETLTKILNRGSYDIYIRNFIVDSAPFVLLDKKELTVPYEEGLTDSLSARIVKGSGQVVYESSDETVATVDNNGDITFLKVGKCTITASVKDNTEVKSSKCNVTVVGLKDYKIYNLDELTDGESSINFPLVTSTSDNLKTYSYDTIDSTNPSVAIRFLVNTTYLEQNRQSVTIWGPTENGISDGNYGMWAACYKGALVFDIYGNNGEGGLKVNGINTVALNSHNTQVQKMSTNTDYYIEAGAIDLAELVESKQYTYFYIKVNGSLVWSTIDQAKDEYRNPLVAFMAVGTSRSKASVVDLVDITYVNGETSKVVQAANGLPLTAINDPKVDDESLKFIGWKQENGSIWNFDSDLVDGPMTLTAVITSEYSTINFDLNYDDMDTYLTKYVGNGMLLKEPTSEPVRDGYRFVCWSTSKDGQAFNFYAPINENITLYAVWVKVYKVSFVYDNTTYLSVSYDENSSIVDPKWGYKDKPDFGEWADRGMFTLNKLANGKAPYYSLTENGEKIDFDVTDVKVTSDITIYIQFMEVETVKGDDEVYDPNTSKWDYVSIRDLNDTPFKTDIYSVTKYDTSTAAYTPSVNNTTDSIIFRGEMILGDKFEGKNVNVGNIALRSSLNAYNSVYLWIRAKEVYLEAKDNSKNVHLAFQSYDMVDGIDAYVEEIGGVTYLKTNVNIPIEYGILAVTTEGFEDYDRVYFKIGGVTLFDVIVPKLCKSAEGASYRAGFVTDSDTASNSAFEIKGVYPDFVIEFKDANGQELQESVTLTKYSYIEKPTYELPEVSGKTFVGWYDANTMMMWSFTTDRVTSHMVLVPTYGYKVIIDPNEGVFADGRTDKQKYDPKEQLVGENCKIEFPTDPVYSSDDGYTYKFAGWETEDGRIWDVNNDVVTANITLKAKWEKYVTITYYVEDSDYKWESKTIKYGSLVGSPKHGDPDSYDAYDDDEHEFIGWYMFDATGDFVKVDLSELEATDNFAIYAIFDDGTGTVIEPEKPVEPEKKSFLNQLLEKLSTLLSNITGKMGCKGSITGGLSMLPILLFVCLKKRQYNKSK